MMRKFLPAVLVFGALVFMAGCGHHRDVRPGAGGLNSVAVAAEDEEEGSRDALSQANHYCDQYDKHAVILDEGTKYTGDTDEQTYKTMKKASKVAKTMGGAIWVNSDSKKNQDIGTTAGVGGAVLDDLAGKGYKVNMKFKCEK